MFHILRLNAFVKTRYVPQMDIKSNGDVVCIQKSSHPNVKVH